MIPSGAVDVLGAAWNDPASLGYPAVFGLVLLGSVVPVVPTGLVVGGGAAVAVSSGALSLPLVVLLSALGAFFGDVLTFALCRFGGPAAVRWVARGQHADRLAEVREQFHRHGWQVIVAGRLLPAGRIPVLLAAGALAYPWRRLLPASFTAGLVWAVAYALLGVVSGGIFDSPLLATGIATLLVLLVGLVQGAVSARRRRHHGAASPHPAPPLSPAPPTSAVPPHSPAPPPAPAPPADPAAAECKGRP